MATAKFNLRKTNSAEEQPIYLKFRYKKKVFTYAVELKIFVKKWDFEKQRAKGYDSKTKIINKHLDFLALTIDTVFLQFRQKGKPFSLSDIKVEFYKKIGLYEDTFSVIDYAEKIDKQRRSIGSKSSLKNIIYTLNRFNAQLTFNDLDHSFYYTFLEFLFQEGKKRSYINQLLTQLIIVCNDATKNNHNSKLDFKNFKRLKFKSDSVHINTKRIAEMYYFNDLSKRQEEAKDLFVLACCVGLRFSDYSKINNDNIKSINNIPILSINDKKKDNVLAVPLNLYPFPMKIIKKYNYKLPTFNNDSFNDIIRVIAEKLNWTEIINRNVYKKNITTESVRFCDIIGSHTARRSFVTNLKGKFADEEIMKMTGHKSSRSFNKYDKQTAEENAILIATKNTLKIAK